MGITFYIFKKLSDNLCDNDSYDLSENGVEYDNILFEILETDIQNSIFIWYSSNLPFNLISTYKP